MRQAVGKSISIAIIIERDKSKLTALQGSNLAFGVVEDDFAIRSGISLLDSYSSTLSSGKE